MIKVSISSGAVRHKSYPLDIFDQTSSMPLFASYQLSSPVPSTTMLHRKAHQDAYKHQAVLLENGRISCCYKRSKTNLV